MGRCWKAVTKFHKGQRRYAVHAHGARPISDTQAGPHACWASERARAGEDVQPTDDGWPLAVVSVHLRWAQGRSAVPRRQATADGADWDQMGGGAGVSRVLCEIQQRAAGTVQEGAESRRGGRERESEGRCEDGGDALRARRRGRSVTNHPLIRLRAGPTLRCPSPPNKRPPPDPEAAGDTRHAWCVLVVRFGNSSRLAEGAHLATQSTMHTALVGRGDEAERCTPKRSLRGFGRPVLGAACVLPLAGNALARAGCP